MNAPLCMDLDALQAFSRRRPFHRWLDLSVTVVDAEHVELLVPWREELLSNPDVGSVHGGILATLVDTAAAFAVTVRVGHSVPTVDMRVDYHKLARNGPLRACGRLVRLGSTLSVAEASIYAGNGELVASGRGVYFCAEKGTAGAAAHIEKSK